MAKQTINIGTNQDDGTGDLLRTAFQKVNENFTEVYNEIGGDSLSSLRFSGSTITSDGTNQNIIINPNGSGKVLKYEDTGGQYANIRFDLAADHSKKFDLTTNNIFTFKIYIPSSGVTGSSPNQVEVKLQDGSKDRPWEGQHGVIAPLELDKWQSVLIDFSEKASSTEFSRIVFQVNGENNNDNVTAYIDDFYYEVPQAHDDFEGNGNIPAWAEDAAGLSIVDNPYKESFNK